MKLIDAKYHHFNVWSVKIIAVSASLSFTYLFCMKSLEFGMNVNISCTSPFPEATFQVPRSHSVAYGCRGGKERSHGSSGPWKEVNLSFRPPGSERMPGLPWQSKRLVRRRIGQRKRLPLTCTELAPRPPPQTQQQLTLRKGEGHGRGLGHPDSVLEPESVEPRLQGFKTHAAKQAILMDWPPWSWFICYRWLSLPVLWGQNFSGIADKGADQQFMCGH